MTAPLEDQAGYQLIAAENHALRTALAEVVGYSVKAHIADDGTRMFEVPVDTLGRWQGVLAGHAPLRRSRIEIEHGELVAAILEHDDLHGLAGLPLGDIADRLRARMADQS